MSAVLKHARDHYFKGATALTLFGDLSAVGGVPTYDAYGIRVPKPEMLLLPFTLTPEQEKTLRVNIQQLHRGLTLEEESEGGSPTLTVSSSRLLRRKRHITLTTEEQRLKLAVHSAKDEALLDTLLRQTVLGEALIEYWIQTGFFKQRSIEDFDKQFVMEAALDEETQREASGRELTPQDAERELEKARKLLQEITPKCLPGEPAEDV